MPNRDDDGTEQGDGFDYEDDLEDYDSEDDDAEPTVACPYCHAEIHEERAALSILRKLHL